jgi:Amt family ammonium transporter
VDDALGVVYTHGIAGLAGGLMVGLLADPKMIVYVGLGKNPDVSTAGLFYGHPKQLLIQGGAALTVIVWDGLVTFLLLKGIGLVMNLRLSDAELEAGDVAVHNEEVYPSETLTRVGAGVTGGVPVGVASPDGGASPGRGAYPDGEASPDGVPGAVSLAGQRHAAPSERG